MTREGIATAQTIEYERLLREHERRAKAAIIKNKVSELVAEGVDERLAKMMAKVFYEYDV